jgi:hypothetical protein
MIYILTYREKGKKKTKSLDIDFVSNGYLKQYRKIQKQINDFTGCIVNYQNNLIKQSEALGNKDDGQFAILSKLGRELKLQLEEHKTSDFFSDRLKAIQYLYEINGIKYEGDAFWNDCVEPKEINDLMEKAAKKDVIEDDLKKKALIDSMKTDSSTPLVNTGDQSTENITTTK